MNWIALEINKKKHNIVFELDFSQFSFKCEKGRNS